jgi:hypothetical protein
MREYNLPDGTPVPAELQEKIANDVRAFDAAQTPEVRSSIALRKLANELQRLRQVIAGEDQSVSLRHAVALEVEALLSLGFVPEQLIQSTPVRRMLRNHGLIDYEGNPRL